MIEVGLRDCRFVDSPHHHMNQSEYRPMLRYMVKAHLHLEMDYVLTYITSGYADDGPRRIAGFFPLRKNLDASII